MANEPDKCWNAGNVGAVLESGVFGKNLPNDRGNECEEGVDLRCQTAGGVPRLVVKWCVVNRRTELEAVSALKQGD